MSDVLDATTTEAPITVKSVIDNNDLRGNFFNDTPTIIEPEKKEAPKVEVKKEEPKVEIKADDEEILDTNTFLKSKWGWENEERAELSPHQGRQEPAGRRQPEDQAF